MAVSISRRALLAGSALVAANFAVGGAAYAANGNQPEPLRPPGAQNVARFTATCLKCDRCRSACPQKCIRTGTLEDGILSWRTPIMDFRRGVCDFCGKCEDACPTGAIRGISSERSVIGIAEIDRERCIAWTSGSCRMCVDKCPYGALDADSSGRPIVDPALCNGCGVCENVCPSNTYRSFSGRDSRGINVRKAAE